VRVLFLTTIIPTQQRMGSEVASQCFIDGLRHNGHQVTVVGYMRRDDVFEPESQDVIIGKRHIETQKAGFCQAIVWFILSLWLHLPYSAAKYYSGTYCNTVKELLTSQNYEIIIIDHPQLAWLKPWIEKTDRLFTIAHNVEHEIYLSYAETSRNWIHKWVHRREARLIKNLEDELATSAKEVWTLTEHDSKYFAKLIGAKRARVFPLPPGLATPTPHQVVKEFDIGLIGSWAWKPNQEGLQWFLQNVYSRLPKSVSIRVAGRGADWLPKQYPEIAYYGFVPDAQDFMAKAKVVAIPTLSGGGIQIKSLDAIASGSAIVATPTALRGISNPPSTVQVAEQPDEFAALLSHQVSSTQISLQENTDYSFYWYRDRQNRFLSELAEAVSMFN